MKIITNKFILIKFENNTCNLEKVVYTYTHRLRKLLGEVEIITLTLKTQLINTEYVWQS